MMVVTGVLHPFFAYPPNLADTPLEHSLLALVAGSLGIRESEVGYQGRPPHAEYDGLVVMPFPDGKIAFTIAERANQFIARNRPVFTIDTKRIVTLPALRIFETYPRCGLFIVRMITEDEKRQIAMGSQTLVVPLTETLLRISMAYDANVALL